MDPSANSHTDIMDPYPLAPAVIVHPAVNYLQRAKEYVAGTKAEKEEHETRAVAEPSCTPRTVHITRPLVKTKIDQPIPQ